MCSLHLVALTCLTIWLGHLMSICCGHQSLSAMWSKNHCKTTRFWYWHGKIHVYQCITCTNTVLNCTYSVHYMYVKSCQVCKYLHREHFLQIFNKYFPNTYMYTLLHENTLFYMKIQKSIFINAWSCALTYLVCQTFIQKQFNCLSFLQVIHASSISKLLSQIKSLPE